ncbi:hypothetical protein [Streptomyces sp. BH104]|uniref:hypothetical protein n=1 Tax=Streptomyces sp. BH104 TaxID=3410407 RepID=UPI003BB768C6
MDPMVMAAGTALVGAMATDTWGQIREATVALWRRVSPERAVAVGAELEEFRSQVLQARREGDAHTEDALVSACRLSLHQLLRQDPTLYAEFRQLFERHLVPALSEGERTTVQSIVQNATVSGGVSIQAGRDVRGPLPPPP